MRESGEPLLTVDHETWGAILDVNADAYNAVAKGLDAHPVDKGDHDRVRQDGVLVGEIIFDLANMRCDLRSLKAPKLALCVAPDAVDLCEADQVRRLCGESYHLVLWALARRYG